MTAQHAPEMGLDRPHHVGHHLFHPDLRDNHHFLATCLAQLAQFVEHDAGTPQTCADDRSYLRGYHAALIDLSLHLSSGDYLPGGLLNGADLPD